MRLHVDGEVVGEKLFTCSFNKDLYAEGLKRVCLACSDENKDILHAYVHGLDILFPEAAIRNHYVKVCFVHCLLIIFLCMSNTFVSEEFYHIIPGSSSAAVY